MAEEAQKAIEITEFVPASKVDPCTSTERTTWGPTRAARKAYKLLNEAMKQTGARGSRQVGGAGEAVPRDDPPGRERPRHAAAPLQGRGAADLRGADRRRRAQGGRAQARGAARRADRLRRVPPRELRGRVRKRYQQAIQKKVEGQEITAAPRLRARRSSTSWRRSRPASPRRARRRLRSPIPPPRRPPAPRAEPRSCPTAWPASAARSSTASAARACGAGAARWRGRR